MSDKDKKKDGGGGDKPKGPAPPQRTGNVAPADPPFVEWLERLWTRGNPPQRLEVWRMVGANRDVRRAMVFFENFREGEDGKLNVEDCARLAGEIYAACQNDCDGAEKRSLYEVAVQDFYQGTQPLLRRLRPFSPQQGYAGVHPDGEPRRGQDDEEDDGALGIKPITHKYLSKMVRSVERILIQAHAAIGDVVQLQQGIIVSQQSHVERLQNSDTALRAQNQDLADRSLDREVFRDKEKMKLKAIGSGLKVTENLLYGWFGMPGERAEAEGDKKDGAAPQKRHAGSREQRLVQSFLEECKDEKLSVQLFGDWKDPDSLTLPDVFAGLGLETPGIFTAQQFGLFVGVSAGLLPPEALDALLPQSGKPQEITEEQMIQALPLLTSSMGVALQQIKQIREEKREAATTKLASGPQQPQGDSP